MLIASLFFLQQTYRKKISEAQGGSAFLTDRQKRSKTSITKFHFECVCVCVCVCACGVHKAYGGAQMMQVCDSTADF